MTIPYRTPNRIHNNPWDRTKRSMDNLLRILDAGRELIFNFDEPLAMREVARKINKGPSYLYRYVENKRELWFAVLHQQWQKFADMVERVVTDTKGSAMEKFQALARFYINFARQEFEQFYFLVLMRPPMSDKPPGPFEEWQDPRFSMMINELFAQIVQEEEIGDSNLVVRGASLWSMIYGTAIELSPINDYFKTVDPHPIDPKDRIDYVIAYLPKMISNPF